MKKLDCFVGVKSVALIVHIDPDTDALASAMVFRNFLKSQFKIRKVDIFAECKTIDPNLAPIVEDLEINKPITKYHTAVIMDCPSVERVGKFAEIYLNAKQKINIDHHDTNKIKADKKFVRVVSSTCEIIYQLFKPYHYELTAADKGKIYAGIITDTNNFSVGAMTPATFKIVSEILPYIDHEKIYNHFFCNNSLRNMQLLSKAIENIVTFNHGRIIISHITKEQAQMFKAREEDYIGISNRLAAISGCRLMCFSHPKNGVYYVSLRARNGGDVSGVALKNGGGGHKGAAAFNSRLDLADIEQNILQDFTKVLSKTKPTKEKIF